MSRDASLLHRRRFRHARTVAVARSLSPARFRIEVLVVLLIAALAVASPLKADEPAPERQRETGAAQASGTLHTVRQIPEACTRIDGVFTGDSAQPYRMMTVRTSPSCQPRARFVEAGQAAPTQAAGWILNDVIRVPSASCPSQQAVTRVWRKPGAAAPARDGQGQSRVYLEDAKRQGAQAAALPQFTAVLSVEGEGCR